MKVMKDDERSTMQDAPTEPTYIVVDATGSYVSGPWFKDQAERLAKRDPSHTVVEKPA